MLSTDIKIMETTYCCQF